VPEVGLGRSRTVPVGGCLDAAPLDSGGLALDAEQPLDDALGVLVLPLAELLVLDDTVGVDEVERRPEVVSERRPDLVRTARIFEGTRVDAAPEGLPLNNWALAEEWTSSSPAEASPSGSTRATHTPCCRR
jgi:hypothetical protein